MTRRIPYVALLLCVFVFLSTATNAQPPLLPNMVGLTQQGVNIISWTAQYDGIKSIGVQRSADSSYNYATIGYVKNLKKGPQAFIDGHPAPGNNWYRLYIVFNSDLTWFSNRINLHVDSAELLKARVALTNDSLQKIASKIKITDTVGLASSASPGSGNPVAEPAKPVLSLGIPDASTVDAYAYIKSQYVFTNPFTGHINVEIKDAKQFRYSLDFFDAKNNKVLEIPRILAPAIIIDKRNFQKKGLYRFELSRDKEKLEAGYITIY